MLFVRKMLPGDLREVLLIEETAFADPWPEEAFSRDIVDGGFCLIDDDKLIGYVFTLCVLDECSLINVAIRPGEQRRGYGEFMLKEVIRHLYHERRIRMYYLDVRESNAAAIRLYSKLGFGKLGIRKNYYRFPPENAVVMGLVLPGEA